MRARGLDFAVWSTAPRPGAVPRVAINGGMIYGHGLLWPAFAPLADDAQLFLYDQRGRGETPQPPGARAARVEHDVLDIVALRQAVGVERWDLVGHSWGGALAILAAAEDPDGVRRVVGFGAAGATSGWLDGLHARALAHLAARGARQRLDVLSALDPRALFEADAPRHADYSHAMYPAWFHDQEMSTLSPPRSESVTGATIAARLRRDGFDWRERFARVRAPVLLIHGEQDAIPIAEAEATTRLVPTSHLVRIPESGHMPFFENPEPAFRAALAFLGAP